MFHRFIRRCFVILFGVPLSFLGRDDGTSSPTGKILSAFAQILIELCLKFKRTLIVTISVTNIHTKRYILNKANGSLKNRIVSLQHCFEASFKSEESMEVVLPNLEKTFTSAFSCFLAGTTGLEHKSNVSSQTFRQSLLSIHEYFYLTAPKVGTFAAFDDYECIILCLRNPSCRSVNLAVAKKQDGKIWCELLSSQKYTIPEEYRKNRTSRHVSFKVGIAFYINIQLTFFYTRYHYTV